MCARPYSGSAGVFPPPLATLRQKRFRIHMKNHPTRNKSKRVSFHVTPASPQVRNALSQKIPRTMSTPENATAAHVRTRRRVALFATNARIHFATISPFAIEKEGTRARHRNLLPKAARQPSSRRRPLPRTLLSWELPPPHRS